MLFTRVLRNNSQTAVVSSKSIFNINAFAAHWLPCCWSGNRQIDSRRSTVAPTMHVCRGSINVNTLASLDT